jgi:hypothetical protein
MHRPVDHKCEFGAVDVDNADVGVNPKVGAARESEDRKESYERVRVLYDISNLEKKV